MSSRFWKSSLARSAALAVSVGVLGSFATAAPSWAAVGTPQAGANCQAQDGKISGRGSTLQTWAIEDMIGAYASDVCGYGAASTNSAYPAASMWQTEDPTDPAQPVLTVFDGSENFAQPPAAKGDWMVAYNYPSAQISGGTGSTSGRVAISCRTDSFSGTDIPYTTTDITAIDGASGAEAAAASGSSNKDCIPNGTLAGTGTGGLTAVNSNLIPPFTPTSQTYFTSDNHAASVGANGSSMSFPVAGSAIAIAINFGGTSGCPATGTTLSLTSADMAGIWGGSYTNWDQLTDQSSLSGCNLSITRIVRNDNSGTTQNFLNYLNDMTSTAGAGTYGAAGATTCDTASTTVGTFAEMDEAEFTTAAGNTNTGWPSGGGCSPVMNGGTSGAPSLIGLLETTTGGVGYADYSDLVHDPGNGANLTIEDVENATGAFEAPNTGGGGSDCTFSHASLPTGASGAVGLAGQYALNSSVGGSGEVVNKYDDVSWNAQGSSSYAVCAMTWDFVFSSEDGNSGSVNPEAYLTSDQRRTLYSFFSYLFTDAGQTTLNSAGYASLPEGFLTSIRSQFQHYF